MLCASRAKEHYRRYTISWEGATIYTPTLKLNLFWEQTKVKYEGSAKRAVCPMRGLQATRGRSGRLRRVPYRGRSRSRQRLRHGLGSAGRSRSKSRNSKKIRISRGAGR